MESQNQKKNLPKVTKPKKAEVQKKSTRKPGDPSKITAWWHQTRHYFGEVWHELSKVVWPSRKETLGSTSVVLVLVILAGIFLGVVDLILSRLVRLLIG